MYVGTHFNFADETEIPKDNKMEIVSIEKQVFERMIAKFEAYVRKVDELCRKNGGKRMGEWLDNQDVCRILNISPRTLQTLRDNGILGYSQICHKMFYKPEDVEQLLIVTEKSKRRPIRKTD